MMLLRPVELAFARFQKTRDAKALAIVFDRTAKELLRVARHVAGDPAAAEDLVQATFLTAIESASSHERGRPVLPWLLGILGNHARAARRAARREPDLQRLRGDVVADVHADVEARDVQRELAAAITRLPDAYRPVLRLWFEHGLDAHEIAAVLERPAGTVRAQLSRGMESLRRLLPASLAGGAAAAVLAGNGLAAVRANVLSHGIATPGLASSLAIGGLLVLNHKVFAAGAAAVLALVCWLWLAPSPGDAPPLAAAPANERPVLATSADAPRPPERDAPARTDAFAVPPAPAPATAPAVAAAKTASLLVHVHAATSGAPLPGIGVAIGPWQDKTNQRAARRYVATDAAGAVRRDGLAPGSWSIDVDRAGEAMFVQLKAGDTIERTIELPDGESVDGTVVDASGQAIADASVVLHGSRCAAPEVAVSDAAGRFHVAHTASGVELQARKRGYSPSLAYAVRASSTAVTLQLRDGGRRIDGRVLAGSKPVAGVAVAVLPSDAAEVAPWDTGKPRVRALWLATDAEGRFATEEAAAQRYVVVACGADASATPAVAGADATASDAHVDLCLEAPVVVDVNVRRAGQPLAGASVTVLTERCAPPIGYLQNLLGIRGWITDADGSVRLSGSLPGQIVIRVGVGVDLLGEARRTVAPGETVHWDALVGGERPLTIRVTAPVPLPKGLTAYVYRQDAPDSAPSFAPIGAEGIGKHDGTRAAAVDVLLTLHTGGAQFVALARAGDVAPSQDEVRFDLRAEDVPSRSLRGRVVDAVAAPIGGETVRAQRTDAPAMLVVMLHTTTAADGTFALGPLPAGRYTLTTGSITAPRPLGEALLTTARDEQLGDLVLRASAGSSRGH